MILCETTPLTTVLFVVERNQSLIIIRILFCKSLLDYLPLCLWLRVWVMVVYKVRRYLNNFLHLLMQRAAQNKTPWPSKVLMIFESWSDMSMNFYCQSNLLNQKSPVVYELPIGKVKETFSRISILNMKKLTRNTLITVLSSSSYSAQHESRVTCW